MKSILRQLLLLSFLLFIAYSDNDSGQDQTPYRYTGGEYIAGPEKELPNEDVYDSHEPNNNNYEPDWKNTINKIVGTSLIVQVSLLLCYILVSRACFIRIMPATRYNEDGYPIKPWSAQNERIYDMSERRYLSNKDDALPSDGDFDTDPEDLEVY